MKTLERYLLREFFIPLAYCILAFLMVMIVYDLFDNLPDFINWHTPFHLILSYYLIIMPSSVTFTLPVSMLLALLYCLSMLAKHSELIAMRASGLSLRRLLLPYLAVGVMGSGILFLLNETIVPQALDTAARFMAEQKSEFKRHQAPHPKGLQSEFMEPVKPGKRMRMTGLFFYNAHNHRHWVIQELDPVNKVVTNGVEVLQLDPKGQKEEWKAVAAWGKYLDGQWWFFDVTMYDLSGDSPRLIESSRKRIMTELTETPRQLAAELKLPDQMTVREIKSYLSLHRTLSPDQLAPFRVDLMQRYSQPWMCLVMVLLAVTMGTRVGRKGPLVGVASSLALFFVYWFIVQTSGELGKACYIAPFVAAWAPNILFGFVGFLGYLGLR